jgi:hypothetical protein
MSRIQTAVATKTSPPTISAGPALRLQRKCACGGSTELTGECEECQRKKLLGQPLQRKLAVNEPSDEFEREADRVAEQVLGMPAPASGPGVAESAGVPLVQRRTTTSGGMSLTYAPSIVHAVLSSRRATRSRLRCRPQALLPHDRLQAFVAVQLLHELYDAGPLGLYDELSEQTHKPDSFLLVFSASTDFASWRIRARDSLGLITPRSVR